MTTGFLQPHLHHNIRSTNLNFRSIAILFGSFTIWLKTSEVGGRWRFSTSYSFSIYLFAWIASERGMLIQFYHSQYTSTCWMRWKCLCRRSIFLVEQQFLFQLLIKAAARASRESCICSNESMAFCLLSGGVRSAWPCRPDSTARRG